MNAIEQTLVWLGVEDYTGLWQVPIDVRGQPGINSTQDAHSYARSVLESLLTNGWVELYICQEPLQNESVRLVPPEDRRGVLDSDSSWQIPEPFGKSVRFGTTDAGLAAYRAEIGWAE